VKPELFQSFRVFMLKMLMIHVVCLSGLLGTHLSLRRLVMFLNIYSLLLVCSITDLIMPLFRVISLILLTMI